MKYFSFDSMPMALTVRDIADTLDIGRNVAYDLVHRGQLRGLKIGKQIRIPKESFMAFLRAEVEPA